MKIEIPANESGFVRVFSLSMTDAHARALVPDASQSDDADGAPGLQSLALGCAALDHANVEVFPVSDLEDMGLVSYLIDGAGIDAETLEPDRFKLSSLEGWVMIVYSSAFMGVAQTLTPSAQLTLIGTYGQPGVDWQGTVDLSTPSALPKSPETDEPLPRKKPSDAAMSGRIATLALLVAFAVVGLMLWVGG